MRYAFKVLAVILLGSGVVSVSWAGDYRRNLVTYIADVRVEGDQAYVAVQGELDNFRNASDDTKTCKIAIGATNYSVRVEQQVGTSEAIIAMLQVAKQQKIPVHLQLYSLADAANYVGDVVLINCGGVTLETLPRVQFAVLEP